jgi:hypothetical protein
LAGSGERGAAARPAGEGLLAQRGEFGLQAAGFFLQLQDAADAGQVEAVGGQGADLGEPVDVAAAVAAGAARAALRRRRTPDAERAVTPVAGGR